VKSQQGSDRFDAVIIGSGMGSLTTAAILADQGLSVVVLEKHSQLGGYTQSFQRESWYWDVAVHYICSMEPGDLFFHGCRYLTENKLRWKKMPHIFDHFCFPGFQVDVPSSPEQYRGHLKSLFPDEHRQIDRYFDDLKKFHRRLDFLWAPKMLSIPIAKFFRPVLKLLFRKIPECSTADYFEQIGCSEKLTAAICAPWGTFGGLPSESSIYEHWLSPGSYLYGAWYPAGGAASIAESLAQFIENRGGSLRTSAGVKEVLVDTSLEKATGVKLESGEVIEGETIISGIGVRQTFEKLLPKQSAPSEMIDLLADYENSVSYVQLFAGLNGDPSVIPGIDGSNYWIASTTRFPQSIKELQIAQDETLEIRSVLLTFPSLKDPDAKSQTLTICAWINYEFFSRWAETESFQRPDDYEAMKRKLREALLRPVLMKFPQLRELIEYVTVSTPITAEQYTGHAEGSAYGLATPPGRFNDDRLRPKTAIDRLFLTGSDIACSGVPGAFAGGVFCASAILKKNVATALIRLDKAHHGRDSKRERRNLGAGAGY
jgi:all-trans-retinol 13,14-reductase